MPRTSIPGLSKSWLHGWPLVGLIAVGLTAIALLHGGVTGGLGESGACTMTVQAADVVVRAAPSGTAQPLETLAQGENVAAEAIVDAGYRKLTGGERWVPADSVAATAGSVC
ncbi:hypothetical protein WIS52_09255 [Pseudonocardia nematodicida]|uniref:SH3 domain-containing protein n=1 Tax=Pseudonocardia nematodicida TaxID=1206997 RepID=A0ABV1K840_9PSEU